MTIEEIKQAKRELEAKLRDELESFRILTGLVPRRINMDHYIYAPLLHSRPEEMIGKVSIDVDLGV